jgi:hypothetical protein
MNLSLPCSSVNPAVPDMIVAEPTRFDKVCVLQSNLAWNFVAHVSVPEPTSATEPVKVSML